MIERAIIVREPLSSLVYLIMNAVSMGKLQEVISKMHYDNAYHLSLHLTLRGYGDVVIQKNEVITVTKGSVPLSKGAETYMLELDHEHSIGEVLRLYATRFGGYNMLNYSAKDRNCQDFILKFSTILKHDLSQQAQHFIKQDLSSLFSSPGLRKLTNSVTNVAAMIRRGVYRASSYMPGSIIQVSLTEMRHFLESEPDYTSEMHDAVDLSMSRRDRKSVV